MATEKQLHLFFSNIPSIRFIFSTGKSADFIRGIYTTSIQQEIDELNKEVELGHPHISVDKNKLTIAADELDPLMVLKKKIRAEVLAEQAAEQAAQVGRDFGNSSTAKDAGLQTSASIAPVTAGSIAAGSIKVASTTK